MTSSFVGFGFAVVSLCTPAYAQGLDARHVVDLLEAIKDDAAEIGLYGPGLASSNGRWAVLAELKNRRSLILTGASRVDDVSPVLEGMFDQIAIDASGRIFLRKRAPWEAATTEIVEWDRTRRSFLSTKVDSPRATPFLSNGTVLWRTPRELVQIDNAGKPIDEMAFTVGLPDGRHATLGNLTEEIRVYDADGSLLSTSMADLNGAYASLGRFIPKFEPTRGRSRIIWASSSSDGHLYICLSELRFLGPAVIAVINANSGSFLKTISLNLPTSSRKKGKDNPEGAIFAGRGSTADELVVVDSGAFLLAVYDH